jgi:carbamoyl-phosphate synthase large subunit
MVFPAKYLVSLGFKIYATRGTRKIFQSNNMEVELANKIGEGTPDILDLIKSGKITLIINIPEGKKGAADSKPIRSTAVIYGIPCITTLQGAHAAINGIESALKTDIKVKSIQEYIK